MYVVDMTWLPNSSMQENMGRESSASHCGRFMGLWRNPASSSLPSVTVVVSGHVVPAHMLSGGILALGPSSGRWFCIMLARTRSQGSNNDLLQFASLPSRCFLVTLEWSTELETMLFLLPVKPRDRYLLLGLGKYLHFSPLSLQMHRLSSFLSTPPGILSSLSIMFY